MDYRKYSEDELRDYGIWRVSLPTMKKEVKLLDEVTVNAINYAADRVDGTGPFDNEDFLLSKMIEKDDKMKNIKFIENKINCIEEALGILSEDELEIIEKSCIDRFAKSPEELSCELPMSISTIRRIKNRALKKYTKYRVGLIDI